VNDQSLTPGDNPRLGTIRFKDWLRQSQARQAPLPGNRADKIAPTENLFQT
jgi:hypothetical protein